MHRILVVEDSYTHRLCLEASLKHLECQWQCVNNGQEALQRLPSFRPDLVISDIAMPVMSGLELYRHLRQRPVQLPILFVSAIQPQFLEELGICWLDCDWLAKPYTSEQLWEKLGDLGLCLRSLPEVC
ncbi:response regulator [Leptolyngbya sp. FACHB-261]|uniref:response regulator n=1 Tax=Leptolyngbya sp. FACHB-261 TaxID=2692806 RepID=UPI001682FDA2|nr:response regulator [Leptolyngbya sp. FACHB-261]MBD2099397.1 response regulator [Leptolyngbya sp. FACHB-261]